MKADAHGFYSAARGWYNMALYYMQKNKRRQLLKCIIYARLCLAKSREYNNKDYKEDR